MKKLLTFSLLLICIHLQSQDLALLTITDKTIESPPAPDYFHKTMALANEPDFRRAGKLLKDGGFLFIAGTVLGAAGGALAYLSKDTKPEVARGLAIGAGAVFITFTVIGGTKISRAGEVLQKY